MRDIIQKVVAIEDEANKLIKDAELQAEKIALEARSSAQRIRDEAFTTLNDDTEAIIRKAETRAKNEADALIKKAQAEISEEVRLPGELVASAAKAVASVVKEARS